MPIPASATLVGREAELTEIATLLGVGAADGTGRSVLLGGDAGVGKTRIVTELAGLARGEGRRVLVGHCLDFGDSALPYLPFSEVLGGLGAELPELVERVANAHPALDRLQPGRRVLRHDDDEATALHRTALFEAVHALLEAAAAVEPLLLVLEDLHWADQSTRDLVSFLLTRPFGGPVAIVASYRSDDLHRRHPLRRQVAEWSRLPGVARVALTPLADGDVRRLVAQLVPAGLSEAGLRDVVARAEGNPFFAEELASAAAETGQGIPAELADVLLVRVDRLDDTARQAVRAASVAGRRVSHEMLSAASGLAPDALDEGLRRAVEMNVLVADDRGYAFRHALLAEAVYDDLLPGERVRLHAAYAEALREGRVRGTAAELARHARLAMDLDTALTASIKAGDEATRIGGPDEAARHYQQALELLADQRRVLASDVDLSKLVAAAADALVATGDFERAAALVQEQLERLPDGAPAAARARLLTARAVSIGLRDNPPDDPILLSEQALALAPADEGALRARVLANHAKILYWYGRLDEAQGPAMEALALAERLDHHVLASEAITTLSSLKRSGPKEGLREALRDAIARAQASGALAAELRGRFLLARSYQDWGEFDEAERWFRSAIDCAESGGQAWAPYGFEARWQMSSVWMIRGAWDDVLELTEAAAGAPPLQRAIIEPIRLYVLQARGEDVSARTRALRRFWGEDGAVAIHAAELEMVAAGRAGDPAAVLRVYDEAVAVIGRIWSPWFSARIRLAAVAAGCVARTMPQLSAAERAEWAPHAERLARDGTGVREQHADRAGHWGPEGRAWSTRLTAEVLRLRWLAGTDVPDPQTLVATWREVEQRFEEFGHVHELARVRATLAAILRACGDTAGARAVADQARATAHELGAAPLLEELRALGSTPVRSEAATDALTARETEILRLVAEGRSNGEIAKVLFISAKTVSVHVSNILAKLGASGRTEAAAIARRRGLLD